MLALARLALGTAQPLAPDFAAWLGERLFFTPPRQSLPEGARPLLRRGRRFRILVDGREIQGWRWGRGPAVYLLHGWGGRGGRYLHYIEPLTELGHSVVVFDAPGHGANPHGMSSAPEFARALQAVVDLCGPARAVVAHSLGAAAAALAVRWGLRPERLVLLAPPADVTEFFEPFARAVGLTQAVMARLVARSTRRIGLAWSELDIRRHAPKEPLPLLVVHDVGDTVVPFADGVAVAEAWGGQLHATQGLGHSGLLRDREVLRTVAAFVTGAAPEDVAAAVDPAAKAERWLWERYRR